MKKIFFALSLLAFSPAGLTDDAAPKVDTPEACGACHGVDGNSPASTFPNLSGQNARYLYLQLKDFKEGRRNDPVMSPIAKQLEKKEMQALAKYFSEQKPKSVSFKSDNAKAAAGKKISAEALCPMCHLGEFAGQNEIPRVAGQHPEYVVKQLKDFRARNRTNDAGNMTAYSSNLTDQDIENLAHYIGTLN
ncbi:MAG: c-type cytochrome [Burkholderiales bacterium]